LALDNVTRRDPESHRERPDVLPALYQPGPALPGNRRGNPDRVHLQGFQIPIRNGKFSLVLNDLSDRLRWSGTIAPTKASGKESIDTAAFDNKGGLQHCGAGSLSWRARVLVPASSSTVASGAAFVVKVTKASNGTVHFSITHRRQP
jgi:hypothetical protein